MGTFDCKKKGCCNYADEHDGEIFYSDTACLSLLLSFKFRIKMYAVASVMSIECVSTLASGVRLPAACAVSPSRVR